ncbi:hypothetical protein THALO_180002 [Tenacibaculum halocynthiae]
MKKRNIKTSIPSITPPFLIVIKDNVYSQKSTLIIDNDFLDSYNYKEYLNDKFCF